MSQTMEQALQMGVTHHQGGRFNEAEKCYRQVLAQQPRQPDALHLLGVLAGQSGRLDEAIEMVRQAIAARPAAAFYSNLGKFLREKGQLDEAIETYRQALKLGEEAETYNNLGFALQSKGELDEALRCYRQAIRIKPGLAGAHYNLGNVLRLKLELDDAIVSYREALRLRPDFADAHNNLGNAYREKGDMDAAIAAYRLALRYRADLAETHSNLGIALGAKHQHAEALAEHREALRLRPDLPEAWCGLGSTLNASGKADEALEAFQQSLKLQPEYAEALSNFGGALKDSGRIDEALSSLRIAAGMKPTHSLIGDALLIALNYYPGQTRELLHDEARRWGEAHANKIAPRPPSPQHDRNPDRRLRIGYVSADFRDHASAFFLMPLLRHHDRQAFEVICYSEGRLPDAVTRRFQSLVDGWRVTTGKTDARIADIVGEDRVDILVDLKLHTDQNRLLVFAHKPAPVQVTWLGYPGTSGIKAMDYRLTDPFLDPPGESDAYSTEESIRLPESFWCYDPLTTEPKVNPLPADKNGYVTFGSLNNLCKVNDLVLANWAQVLHAVADSRLLILAPEGSGRERVLAKFRTAGIDSARIEFVARKPRGEYLPLYHRIDIGLDTMPCNGHTTSLDSLWMGVPVVTLAGPTAMGRAGLSQLMNLGLSELVAQTPEQFVQIAANLAADRPRLAALRSELRPRMEKSPLMDAPRFARNMEAAFREMWRRWCAGEKPR